MADEETSLYLILVVAIVSIVGLALAVSSFATRESVGGMMGGGGGMMGGTTGTSTSPPGTLEWALLIVSAAFLMLALGLFVYRGRRSPVQPPASPASAAAIAPAAVPPPAEGAVPAPPTPAVPTQRPPPDPALAPPVAEPTLVRLLNDDERRMYLEIRDHGGAMLQRDLVALGTFSKAKVTRVLDKLEAKGLVVREAHGMTNRVRLVPQPAR